MVVPYVPGIAREERRLGARVGSRQRSGVPRNGVQHREHPGRVGLGTDLR
jgi:hypothetical protein